MFKLYEHVLLEFIGVEKQNYEPQNQNHSPQAKKNQCWTINLLDLKNLLIDACQIGHEELSFLIPLVVKMLESCALSKVNYFYFHCLFLLFYFKKYTRIFDICKYCTHIVFFLFCIKQGFGPTSQWTVSILQYLAVIQSDSNFKLTLKFEIEILFKSFYVKYLYTYVFVWSANCEFCEFMFQEMKS